MKLKPTSFPTALCLAGLLLLAGPGARIAQADPYPCSLSPNLVGAYAFQFNGSVFLPGPFDKFNGPFFRNGRFVADGNGNLTTTVVTANYGGTVVRETYSATYAVKSDGTFTITIVNLPIPAFPPGTPNTFTFDGVFANCANNAKVVLSGVTVAGQVQPNLGSVISGEFIKQ